MASYRIELRETRLSEHGTDDVALFDVTREQDGETWTVPAYVSPLFQVMHMHAGASPEQRRDMVAGLGARAIVEHLKKGAVPPLAPLLFALDYPGAPGEPQRLSPYEHATVVVDEGSS
jgi:hypothetical protein